MANLSRFDSTNHFGPVDDKAKTKDWISMCLNAEFKIKLFIRNV